jgi:16S rRNA (uracil1498-N3)-methyltransferase
MPATPAWPPKSTPRLFVDGELAAGQVRILDGNAAHYLGTVMRKSVGDPVLLCDNISGEWLGTVGESGKRRLMVLVERQTRQRAPLPDLWLCASPLKKPRFDWVLEKASEIGVARIMPVVMDRSVADKVNAERARTIVTEAAEQCGGTALPEIAGMTSLRAMLPSWPADRALIFADELGGEPILAVAQRLTAQPAAILIGPEGGFTGQERALVRALPQAIPVTLGPRILRAETAAIAALAICNGARDAAKTVQVLTE